MISVTATHALLAVVVLAFGLMLVRWPEIGTLVATAVLYLNLLPVAIRYHHLSPVLAAGVAALAVPSLLKHWFVDGDGLVVDRTFLLMLVFLACTIVSALFSKSVSLSLPWIAQYIAQGMFVYLLLINVIRSKDQLRRIFWVIVSCGVLLASLTVYQEMTKSYANNFGGLATRHSVTNERSVNRSGHAPAVRVMQRADGPDLDANRYAQILIVLLPLTWCLLKTERGLHARWAAAGCGALILGGVLLTYSRGAFVGLVALFGLMAVLRVVTWRQVILGCAVALIGMILLSPGYFGRMGTLRGIDGLLDPASHSGGAAVDPIARERGAIMLAAWNVFLDYPILGVGPGQFSGGYIMEYVAELYAVGAINRAYATHSLYLQLAAETGLLGLGVFMLIAIGMLGRLLAVRRRAWEGDRFVGESATAVLLALVTYLVTALFLHLSYQRYFWLLVGLGGAAVQICDRGLAELARSSPVGLPGAPEGLATEGRDSRRTLSEP